MKKTRQGPQCVTWKGTFHPGIGRGKCSGVEGTILARSNRGEENLQRKDDGAEVPRNAATRVDQRGGEAGSSRKGKQGSNPCKDGATGDRGGAGKDIAMERTEIGKQMETMMHLGKMKRVEQRARRMTWGRQAWREMKATMINTEVMNRTKNLDEMARMVWIETAAKRP